MAASAGHAAYAIGTLLYFKASIVSGMSALIFDGTPQMIVQRCQIAAPRWQDDISSAADNAIFKNSAQYIECSFGCVARSAVLLKPNVANILLFNFCARKFVPHVMASLCSFSKKNGPIMLLDQNPHQRVTRRLFNVSVRDFGFNSWTNWTLMSSNCSIVENDGELMLFRFTHSFCHSSNILESTHCFWLFRFWFIDEDVSFFHFFHKITNIRS